MTALVTQTFVPGPRLIDGSDLNNLVAQINAALGIEGGNTEITALSTVGAGTITAAGIVGGITSRAGAQSATAFTDTTATAAQIIAAMGSALPAGSSFLYTYLNTTDATATIAAGSSVTLSGNVTVPKLTWATYLVTKATASAVTMAYATGGQLNPLPVTKLADDSGQATTVAASGLVGAQLNVVTLTGANPAARPLPPAAQIIAAMPQARLSQSFQVLIRNPSVNSCTLSGLTGTTISGTASIATLTGRLFNVNITSLGSVEFTSLNAVTL